MQIHLNQLPIRIGGTAFGLALLALGTFTILAMPANLPIDEQNHLTWLGATVIATGTCAVVVSWLVQRLDNIWCAPPKRNLRS
jgi:cysteine synthase